MSERILLNRVKKLKELEQQKKELEKEIGAIQDQIKGEMQLREIQELPAGEYLVRWTTVVSNKFDSSSFKADHKTLYSRYLKTQESRRFSIA